MIERVDGFWWPIEDTRARAIIPNEAKRDIPKLLEYVRGRDCIVQAGANAGWWPRVLAGEFARVYTVEPHEANYAALVANELPPNVHHGHAAFGSVAGWTDTNPMEPGNLGSVELVDGTSTLVITIDSLELEQCDAIWLDVEGSELEALMGATDTIKRLKPMIVVEDKGIGVSPGVWLDWIGYEKVFEVARDHVYKAKS